MSVPPVIHQSAAFFYLPVIGAKRLHMICEGFEEDVPGIMSCCFDDLLSCLKEKDRLPAAMGFYNELNLAILDEPFVGVPTGL